MALLLMAIAPTWRGAFASGLRGKALQFVFSSRPSKVPAGNCSRQAKTAPNSTNSSAISSVWPALRPSS